MENEKFKRIHRTRESKGPNAWEYQHDETWECDQPFTPELAQELIDTCLNYFPIVKASYTFNPEDPFTLNVHVVEDNCN